MGSIVIGVPKGLAPGVAGIVKVTHRIETCQIACVGDSLPIWVVHDKGLCFVVPVRWARRAGETAVGFEVTCRSGRR
jgi:hypothetical protein